MIIVQKHKNAMMSLRQELWPWHSSEHHYTEV